MMGIVQVSSPPARRQVMTFDRSNGRLIKRSAHWLTRGSRSAIDSPDSLPQYPDAMIGGLARYNA